MPFKKGQSGNPGGRPKIDPEVRALCEELTPEAINTLAEIMRDAQASKSARCTAATAILKKTLPDLTSTELSGSMTLSHEEALDELDDGPGTSDPAKAQD